MATLEQFQLLDIRVGTVVAAEALEGGALLALTLDFGPELGQRSGAAELAVHYKPDRLIGREVLAIVNLPTGRIGGFLNEVLILGVPDEDGAMVLIRPDFPVPPGGRVF